MRSVEVVGGVAAELAASLGGRVVGGNTVVVEREGVPLTVEPAYARHEWFVDITAPLALTRAAGGCYRDDGRARVDGRPDLELRVKSTIEALGERLGMDERLLEDGSRFADWVTIESDAPAAIVAQVLEPALARAAILELLRLGCHRVKIRGSEGRAMIQVRLRQGRPLEEATLTALARLVVALPPFAEGSRTWRRSPQWLGPLLGFATFVCGGGLTALGMTSFEPESDAARSEVAALALRIGLPLFGLVAVLLVLVGRRRRRPGGLGWIIITLLGLLPGLPALVAGIALVANAKLDHGPAELRVVRVIGKEVEIARNTRARLPILIVEGWRSGQPQPERIRVSEAQYATARPGQRVTIRLRPGRLGWRWWEGWELEPP